MVQLQNCCDLLLLMAVVLHRQLTVPLSHATRENYLKEGTRLLSGGPFPRSGYREFALKFKRQFAGVVAELGTSLCRPMLNGHIYKHHKHAKHHHAKREQRTKWCNLSSLVCLPCVCCPSQVDPRVAGDREWHLQLWQRQKTPQLGRSCGAQRRETHCTQSLCWSRVAHSGASHWAPLFPHLAQPPQFHSAVECSRNSGNASMLAQLWLCTQLVATNKQCVRSHAL